MNNRLLSFVRRALSIVQQRVDRYSCKYSKKVFQQPQLVVLNLLRIREGWTYQQTIEHLEVMDTIQDELDLNRIPIRPRFIMRITESTAGRFAGC